MVSKFIERSIVIVILLMITTMIHSCGWVDSTGRQSNSHPEINVVVNGSVLTQDQAIAMTESRSEEIDFSSSTDVDGEVVAFESLLTDQGKLEQCADLINLENASNLLREACEPDVNNNDCTVTMLPTAQAHDESDSSNESIEGNFTIIPPRLSTPIGMAYRWTITDNDGGESYRDITYCLNTLSNSPIANADIYQLAYNSEIIVPEISFNSDCTIKSGASSVLGNDSNNYNSDTECLTAELLTPPDYASNDFSSDFTSRGGFHYIHNGLTSNDQDSFTYRAFDGTHYSNTVTVTLNIDTEANQPPIAEDDNFNVVQNSVNNALHVLHNDDDPENLPLTIHNISTPPDRGGSAKISADGVVLYSPVAQLTGKENFDYEIVDSGGITQIASVQVTIQTVNELPVAVADTVELTAGQWFYLDVLANDNDTITNNIKITSVSNTDHGGKVIIDVNGRGIIYRSVKGFKGIETFTYTIENLLGNQSTALVTITVL